MRGIEPVHAVVAEWVVKAEHDLLTAAHTLKLGANCPTDTVAFHAQQCVEKYLKALLTLHGEEFPRTHNLAQLVALCPPGVLARWPLLEQRQLTEYAVVARYPGAGLDITLSEARRAVRIARKIRREVRKLLPKSALTLRRPRQRT